ncbi:2-hydroxychromene-2-carboxylate isomerase [Inmirania thermothiophila]|uniref:2-hydroxychromene-2-carboxylate isomerase n=1 Tax=Inmirania thermothiophila TaxID=1750597 RepID=A0A3N1Y708_9GAMM|nr:2-hydroxychromene-2-carboxylate isomerase [Inmirania thermothiophila]ROR34555.1 2-hydroxychromene-2-carboxylate isomerase [Inmirania thermothiophila]
MTVIDFFFSPVSPWTYLGMPRLRRIGEAARAEVRYRPVDLGPIFATVEVKPLPQRPEPLKRYRLQDLARTAEFLRMPLVVEPRFFPTDPMPACRVIAQAVAEGREVGELAERIMAACWVEERDIADWDTLAQIGNACRLDGPGLIERARRPETARMIAANTEEAIRRGVIGSPCYLLGEEIFFGQDRLDQLAWRLGLRGPAEGLA